jgi:hypothetical protein
MPERRQKAASAIEVRRCNGETEKGKGRRKKGQRKNREKELTMCLTPLKPEFSTMELKNGGLFVCTFGSISFLFPN